jgi:2-methylcitrate dehydratase PrpD
MEAMRAGSLKSPGSLKSRGHQQRPSSAGSRNADGWRRSRAGEKRGTILLLDGRTATATVGLPLGSRENRLSAEQLTMEFTDCVRHAVRPLSDDAIQAAIDMIRHLEEVPNVSDLLRCFV